MSLIIAFAGRKGAGKTTAAEMLVSYYGFKRLSFAGPLKAMLKAGGFGDPQTLEEKEAVIPWLGCSWRHLGQTLGTEWGRNCVREDLWVLMALRQITDPDGRYVFDDCRFENEAKAIREAGGHIVHLKGRGASGDAHVSEVPLQVAEEDLWVANSPDRSKMHLRADLESLLHVLEVQ